MDKNTKLQEELDKEEPKADEAQIDERIEEKDRKIDELTNQLKRAVADYRNLERRTIEQKLEEIRYANKNLIEALLPAFDTLILAGKFTQDESVKLTIGRVLETLKENGIEKIETIGAKYNADTMEAVEIVEGNEGEVIEEIRPGFTLNGKLIRPAQVKVGKGN